MSGEAALAMQVRERTQTRAELGDVSGAMARHEEAARPDRLRDERRELVLRLARLGRIRESTALCHSELRSSNDGRAWLGDRIVEAMEEPDLTLAGQLAAVNAALERASEWFPQPSDVPPPARVPGARLSLGKLRHDAFQLRYLQDLGALDRSFDKIIEAYERAAERFDGRGRGHDARTPLSAKDEPAIGRAYGRIVHLGRGPRVKRALSKRWSRDAIQTLYRRSGPGVVVIDDFLSDDALESLYRFCLESTVWTGNRYAHGRLGAFFFTGFNCPLLLQIAEEIRDELPEILGERHPLRQLWGFKNTAELPARSTLHADFAAVNVNFWITPDSANLDDSSGGMRIYDVDAPLSWDFATYNERIDVIREFLTARAARVIRVPYRRNRAILFNSDLFHETEAVRFRPDYDSHRINVTMLYGDRRGDLHHPPLPEAHASKTPDAWRSAAFPRRRRRW